MADLYDQASDREEQDRALALKVRMPTLKPCGACHYCGESVRGSLLFCNADCRDDHEAAEAARKRNGA